MEFDPIDVNGEVAKDIAKKVITQLEKDGKINPDNHLRLNKIIYAFSNVCTSLALDNRRLRNFHHCYDMIECRVKKRMVFLDAP